ncbi:hypothetical protein HPB49_004732 [Dermacentor silvarum]|uniref:Uncharacterized protein n=1 Tax=Dermacentor silvarum TaxID=543639 RepID=A0ACB8DUL3_DERSI|nr:hypothetical protein HPB49_004732 [Dermacentor silvarum]
MGRPHARPRGRAAAGGRPESAAEPRALGAAAVSCSALRPLDCAVRSAALCFLFPSTAAAAPRAHVTHQCSSRRATTAAVDVRPTSKMALEKPAHQRPPARFWQPMGDVEWHHVVSPKIAPHLTAARVLPASRRCLPVRRNGPPSPNPRPGVRWGSARCVRTNTGTEKQPRGR